MNDIEKAIESLKMENELMQFDPMTGEDYPIELQNQDNQDLYKANLIAISALERQLNGGWIPVSERLPEEKGFYIFHLKGTKRHEYYYEDGKLYADCIHDEEYLFDINKSVTAWMPLPELYSDSHHRQGWIPVSERLPQNNEHILLLLKDEKGKTAQVVGYLYYSDNEKFKNLNGEFKSFDGDDLTPNFLNKEYVVAWQPLPEQYEAV